MREAHAVAFGRSAVWILGLKQGLVEIRVDSSIAIFGIRGTLKSAAPVVPVRFAKLSARPPFEVAASAPLAS